MEKNIPNYLKQVKMNGKLNAMKNNNSKFKTYKYVVSQDEIREIEEQYLTVSYEVLIDKLDYNELIVK